MNQYKFDAGWDTIGQIVQRLTELSFKIESPIEIKITTLGPAGGNPEVEVKCEQNINHELKQLLYPDPRVEEEDVFEHEEI